VELVDDCSPWRYDEMCPVCGYDSLYGLEVHGRLSGMVLIVAEYPPEEGAMSKVC
jgi:hypothetical protein